MNLDIETAVKYPMQSEDWLKTVGIGGILALLSVLIIPLFLLYGFFVRVLRAGMRGAEEPPVFDEWGELLTEGLWAIVILFVYQLVPIIVFAFTVGGSIMAIASGNRTMAGVGMASMFGGMMLTLLLALVFGYVGLVGIANFANSGSLSDGFDFSVVRRVALSREYAVPWVVGILVLFAASIVTGILSIVPVIGQILGVFVTFYAYVVAGNIWGRGYAAAMNLAPPDVGPSDRGTATAVD